MKKQNLVSALNNSSLAIIFLFALAFGTAQSVFAQFPREVSVKVGEIKTFKVQQQIIEDEVKAEVGNATIARARFDKDKKEFRVQGLKEGTTRIVFSGNYRGGNSMMGALQPTPFNETVNVTVLPNTETTVPNQPNTTNPNQTNTTPSNIYRVQINRHEIKNISIATLLRQEPDKSIEGLELTPGDNNIARGDYDGGQTIRLTGIGSGNTSLILIGKIINNNEEQSVRRIIEVTVAADNKPNNIPPDSWLESRQQDLQELKKIAALAGTDERKLDSSIQNFGSFVRRVGAEILRESNSQTPRQLREALLKNLRDEANRDSFRLREQLAEIAKQIRPIRWNDALYDLNLVLGALPARRTFFCPANPEKRYSSVAVYGTNQYLINSTLCVAALHRGVINLAGGNIRVVFHKGTKGDKYLGSERNGVTTQSWEQDWGWFVFEEEQR